jgi:hypothetical protein
MRLSIARKEQLAMGKFGYTFKLPTLFAPDVAKREFVVKPSNADEFVVPAVQALNQPVSEELVFSDEGSPTISLMLRDVDSSGNVGATSEPLEFQVNDDVAPPAPGALSIANKRQVE